MDEPTNHLDIRSKQVLKSALQQFEGTLIIISHDRDFLEGLSDRVLEFKNRQLKPYLGDIRFYLEQKKMDSLRDLERETAKKKKAKGATENDYHRQKKVKGLRNKQSKIEAQISALEKELKETDLALEINYEETIAVPHFFDTYHEKKAQLEKLMIDWEKVSEDLDDLTADQ